MYKNEIKEYAKKRIIGRLADDAINLAFKKMTELMSQNLVYTYDITKVACGIQMPTWSKFFHNVPEARHCYRRDDTKYVDKRPRIPASNFTTFTIYKKTLVIAAMDLISDSWRMRMFCCKNKRDIANMKELLDKMIEYDDELLKRDRDTRDWTYYKRINPPRVEDSRMYLARRSFDSVFIEKEDETKLKQYLSHFVESEDWYIEHDIPYHLGIMLYGPPGTGKTSVVLAMADYLNCPISVISKELMNSPDLIAESICQVSSYEPQIILFEDIDCLNVTHNRNQNNQQRNPEDKSNMLDLSSFLNLIDGLESPENVVYVFTTNHPENLDPAMIRPGRIDLALEIGCVKKDPLKRFIKSHYHTDVDIDFDIREDMTFAQLQMLPMVGTSLEDFLKAIRKDS